MDKKVNRNTHPILVEARSKSYMAGHKDGYQKGYEQGYEEGYQKAHKILLIPYEAQIACLKTIIAGLEEKNRGDT